jgi:anti-sigma regulatory factor (Ser/Thr protein kinase)
MQAVMDTFEHSYEASAESIARIRADLAAFAAGHGMHSPRVEDVRLAVSEAVTNAVLHAYRGTAGSVHVTARLADGGLWVSVRDFGRGMRSQQAIATGRTGMGLGLALIGRLVSELAVTPQPGGGTELRMRFALMPGSLRADRRAATAARA